MKSEILDFIKKRGAITADEATQYFQLAKTTIRQHLLGLEKNGLIQREVQKTTRGRPKVSYQISESGSHLYPTQDPVLLRELLTYLLSTGKKTIVDSFFKKFWQNREKQFRTRLALEKKKTLAVRIRVLTQILEEEGFMPTVETNSLNQITIRECNCPFSQAVKATKLPCKLEADFIQTALNTKALRVSYIPNGSSACNYKFNQKNNQRG